jgi:hypothetical protein
MPIESSKTSPKKTVQSINATQLQRLDRLIGHFKKRDQKLVYLNGLVQSDDSLKISLNFLQRSDPRNLKIARNAAKQTLESGRGFGKAVASNFAAVFDEHSVLDLFHKACLMIPGFEAATARRLRKQIARAGAAKPAVAPIPYDGSEPALQFESPLLEHSQIRPSKIYNALALGSTGSGKTVSFVQPALFSMLAYRLAGGKTASILVIDPKVELLTGIERKLKEQGESDRLVVVGQGEPIAYFQEDDGLSLADRFEKAKQFVVAPSDSAEDNRWQAYAEFLLLSFLRDDQNFADICRLPLLESLASLVTGDVRYLKRNQWVALRKLLLLGMEDTQNLRRMSDIYDALTYGVGMTTMERPFARYLAIKDSPDQYFYNARGALTVLDGLGSDDIEGIMDFSVRRGLKKDNRCDVAALIDRGAVLVFQPRQSATHDLVGGALKSLFFRCVMERQDMERPIGYFCDEFQRYITFDPETGEHAFLDRCRAYRVNSFLATQSMAALLVASKRGVQSSNALSSILVNTPTKVCFRTSDESSVATMKSFIPKDPTSQLHVLNFRPPSSLLTGEYYFAFGHSWGRTRYQLPARPALTV